MKTIKLLAWLLCLSLLSGMLFGCISPDPIVNTTAAHGGDATEAPNTNTAQPTDPTVTETEEYQLDIFTQNMFSGDMVYYDSICFAEQADGSVSDGVLLFTPDQILSVRSADLKTVYEEGTDYTVEGNRLIRTEGSRIPVFTYDQYAQPATDNPSTGWLRIVATDLELIITDQMMKCQVFVTYTHSDQWSGAVASSQLSHLPRTAQKLANKEPLKIVFYGDSITCGYDASGMNETVIQWQDNTEVQAVINRAPYMPSWAEMVTAKLRQTYGYEGITKVNRASGGTGTYWGKNSAAALINPEKPDLVVIGFGMNQPSNLKNEFKTDILAIIQAIRKENPETEFLLISAMMPNTDSVNFRKHKLAQQEEALYALQEELPDVGIGVVPVHSVFASMIENGKKFLDYTSNNINHPNDFAVRVYAQLILAALEG